jgi:hypothetical protein
VSLHSHSDVSLVSITLLVQNFLAHEKWIEMPSFVGASHYGRRSRRQRIPTI